MSIIIRLQNLPLSAKASDIRDFFSNLKIPKGAVNIVGGCEGDAFIGFATDEDARLAMRFEGKLLHNAKVKLLLSSKAEMDSVISAAHAMAKAESFSGGASAISQLSSSPIALAGHTKPFADVTPEGLKKDVKAAPFNFGAPSIIQISGQPQPSLVPQNNPSNGEFGDVNNSNSAWSHTPVVNQLPSDSWKTTTSSHTAFQASPFVAPSSISCSAPIPQQQQQQQSTEPKLFYSNKTPMESPLGGGMYGQQQSANHPSAPNGFAPAGNNQQPPPFAATNNNPPFSPPFLQQNPYATIGDEAHAPTHSYQQHFDPPGARQTGPPVFANAQYPPAPQQQLQQQAHQQQQQQLQQPRNGAMGNAPAKAMPPPFQQQQQQQHTYEQSAFNPQQQPSPKSASNAPWMYPPPNQVHPNAMPEQNQYRNMGNENSPYGQTVPNKPAPSPTNVYVELSRLPTELLRPANLESFLSPTVPLTLSSVKVVHNPDGSVMHALVKFGSEEDAKRILNRNGDRGIKVSYSSEATFNNAMDGILGAAVKPMVSINNKRLSPPAMSNNHQRVHQKNNYQAKRRREADVWQSGNDNDFDHRHKPDNKERDRSAFDQSVRGNNHNQYVNKKDRICVQLTNVPYKATYDNIRDYVCSSKGSRYEKITRTYYAGKNLSDRWIIEFSNEREATNVYKSRAEILGRRIHCEYVTARAADDQYAIPEPEERNRGGQQRNAPFQPAKNPPPQPANAQPAPRKRDSQSDIPNMTLEASTLDELITRGDLPPTSFGAFQSAAAPILGILRKTGFTSKIGMGNLLKNNGGNNPSFNPPATNSNAPAPRGAPYQNSFSHGPGHQAFVPPPSNFSRPWPAGASQEPVRQSPPQDPKLRSNQQIHEPAVKAGLLPYPPNFSQSGPNGPFEEESPVPLFSIKFQNGLDNGDPRRQPSNLRDSTLNSTCDTENGRLMIVEPDSSAMSSASGHSIAGSVASSSIEKMSPYASFLERARENGELKTAIRLENVQKMVIAEKLCQFLGVQLVSPSENIARMPDGSLYVNLSNEEWANKAAGRNGAFLERNKIFIQQISRNQMAQAIHQNLLNAPKPSEHALVARGFDKITTPNQVAVFFEKFHPLTVTLLPDGADSDNSASFVVTFTDAQECGAALMILNNTKLCNRVISLQMGPVNQ